MLFQNSNVLQKSICLLGMFALVAVGCTSTMTGAVPPGPQFQPVLDLPEEKGVIYIYKPKTRGKSIYDIFVNGEIVTKLFKGGYYPYVANSGKNTIVGIKRARLGETATVLLGMSPDLQISVNVEAGKSYFVEREGGFSPNFKLVPEGEALPLLRDTVLLSPAIITKVN